MNTRHWNAWQWNAWQPEENSCRHDLQVAPNLEGRWREVAESSEVDVVKGGVDDGWDRKAEEQVAGAPGDPGLLPGEVQAAENRKADEHLGGGEQQKGKVSSDGGKHECNHAVPQSTAALHQRVGAASVGVECVKPGSSGRKGCGLDLENLCQERD